MVLGRLAAGLCLLGAARSQDWCQNVDAQSNGECFVNVEWAMRDGIHQNASMYPAGTTTFPDFQCALFLKSGQADGPAHGCSKPPCANLSATMEANGEAVKACLGPLDAAEPIEEQAAGPSMPWWGWILIVLGVLLAGVGLAFAMGVFKIEKKPKKKRAVRMPPAHAGAPETAEAEPAPQAVAPTQSASMPMYTVMSPGPVQTGSYLITAPPMLTSARVVAAAPVYAAAPLTGTSTSIVAMSPPQGMSTVYAPMTPPPYGTSMTIAAATTPPHGTSAMYSPMTPPNVSAGPF
eukprot:TRINITY_DN7253_c0_g1_i1.p1 TRINITY_DN7253_c0_g1~~TRINITY_DN7253_c0_g1_i1.p1  ORF type:complete len:292 (+),score=46.39 TRINITY_DN7253_c0_g1_i1:77-952(+)